MPDHRAPALVTPAERILAFAATGLLKASGAEARLTADRPADGCGCARRRDSCSEDVPNVTPSDPQPF